jgi:hypothetical protein
LASPRIEKGANNPWMIWPVDWMAPEIKLAVPDTITGKKATAKRITMIRIIHGFITDAPYGKFYICRYREVLFLISFRRPQMKISQIIISANS